MTRSDGVSQKFDIAAWSFENINIISDVEFSNAREERENEEWEQIICEDLLKEGN